MRLTEEEGTLLMDAVEKVLKPWTERISTTIAIGGEGVTIRPVGISPHAPKGIAELGNIYDAIIAKSAFAVSPEYIPEREEKK